MKDKSHEATEAKDLELVIKWVSRTPYLIGFISAALLIAYAIAFASFGWSKSPDAWGQLGDYIGGILNPIVALCALIALVVSIQLQKAELAATRAELASAKAVAEEQAKTTEQQRQEQRFFDLLNLYQRTIDSITFVDRVSSNVDAPALLSTGKQAFGHWLNTGFPVELKNFLRYGVSDKQYWRSDGTSYRVSEETLVQIWSSSGATSQFDHYLRVVFRLLAESESLLRDQHFRYVKLLRAQLNRAELTIIGLNIWLDDEGKRMIPLVAKYGLLKHLAQGHLRTQLALSLPPEIFGRTWAMNQLANASKDSDAA